MEPFTKEKLLKRNEKVFDYFKRIGGRRYQGTVFPEDGEEPNWSGLHRITNIVDGDTTVNRQLPLSNPHND